MSARRREGKIVCYLKMKAYLEYLKRERLANERRVE